MAEAFGAILRFLGAVLSAVYDVIPSYGLAIVILTLLVRVVLVPLTVKQIRSMTAMQRLQPELKRIQTKYKGDRQKMNEELMKLYREHGVNPLGGCFPLLMQAPVFIALYSVLRAAVPVPAAPAAGTTLTPADLPPKNTICRPVEAPSAAVAPAVATDTPLVCEVRLGDDGRVEEKALSVTDARRDAVTGVPRGGPLPEFVTICDRIGEVSEDGQRVLRLGCRSPVGTGHLPKDESGGFKKGSLGDAIVEERATFLGMHLACSPTQASSRTTIRQCTAAKGAGTGPALIGYYLLIALMAGTTWYQQRQMAAQATGPQAKQMQMMGRIMPVFLAFISLSIPAGVIIYWIVSNVWTIGQQQFFLTRQQAAGPPPGLPPGGKGKPAKPKR